MRDAPETIWLDLIAAHIKAAVLAEREACAMIAEDYKLAAAKAAKLAMEDSDAIRVGVGSYERCAETISSAIRARTDEASK